MTSAGAVKCWGSNHAGPLGDGTERDSAVPVDVVGLGAGAVMVSAGNLHTCVVTSADAVKCWGNNWFGQVGSGTNTDFAPVPVDVVGLGQGLHPDD